MPDTPGVTAKQTALFAELLDRKQFPAEAGTSESLTATFSTLTKRAASEWIDKALALPNRTEEDDTGSTTPAPF